MAIRVHLGELLARNKMNQKQLAQLTNMREATVSDLRNERLKRLDLRSLDLMCKALNCQPGDILDYVPEE